jgi:hypothetical protein
LLADAEGALDVDEAGVVDVALGVVWAGGGVAGGAVVAAPVVGGGVAAPEVGGALPLTVLCGWPMQAVEDPAWMVMGADCAMVPVLSRSWRPIEVPAARLAIQVKEVPVC